MIFSHGPLGLAAAYLFRKKWAKNLERREQFYLYLFACVGALIPDIDLVFYYFYAANFSHHEIFTHGIFFWALITLFSYALGKFRKNKLIKKGAGLFGLGVLTHLMADSLGAGVAWLAPFSAKLYGLTGMGWFGDLWSSSAFIINYSLETLCWLSLGVILTHYFIKHKKTRLLILGLMVFGSGIIIGSLFYINAHLFHYPGEVYYADLDKDGIVNLHDFDQDGDRIINLEDEDINGNGVSNKLELYNFAQTLTEVWYDPTNGEWFEIPLRLGMTTDTDLVLRIYNTLGIFVKEEMQADYKVNPEDYHNLTYPGFERDIINWQAWLKHKALFKTYTKETKLLTGDILFMEDGTMAIVDGSTNDPGIKQEMQKKLITPGNYDHINMILASKEKGAVVLTNDFLLNRDHGKIKFVGRILKD